MQAAEITALYVREQYLQPFGSSNDGTDPLSDGQGNSVSDFMIETHISGSIAEAEAVLGTFLSTKRVKTYPALRGFTEKDYDVEGKPLTYNQEQALRFNELHLPHRNIQSVQKLEMWHATQKIGEIPDKWIAIKAPKEGIIHLVPLGGGILISEITFLGVGVRSYFFRDKVPNFWVCDYTCGIKELPDDIKDYICFRTAIFVLGITALAKYQGVSAESISLDGISQNVSTTATSQYSRYAELQKLFADACANLPKKRRRYRGVMVGSF